MDAFRRGMRGEEGERASTARRAGDGALPTTGLDVSPGPPCCPPPWDSRHQPSGFARGVDVLVADRPPWDWSLQCTSAATSPRPDCRTSTSQSSVGSRVLRYQGPGGVLGLFLFGGPWPSQEKGDLDPDAVREYPEDDPDMEQPADQGQVLVISAGWSQQDGLGSCSPQPGLMQLTYHPGVKVPIKE